MKNNTTKQDGRKNEWLFLLVFFVFTIASSVLGILCLAELKSPIISRYFELWVSGVSLIASLLCGVSIWFVLSQKEALTKTALSLFILIIFSLTVLYVLQKTGFFAVIRSSALLQEYLEKAGVWMPLFYILLQYLQVVILPIPSIVSTVAGVALFGPFWTMLYSLLGIVFGSFTAFFIGRKLGYKAVEWMVGGETLKKWQKKIKGKDRLLLTLMFLLPLFPDDILCFLAGLTSMSTRYFTLMMIISRILAISSTCYSIDFIPINTWWGATLWIVFLIGVILISVWIYKNMDRVQAKLKRFRKKAKQKFQDKRQ